MTHLSEEDRHAMADGSLAPDAHLESCAECAADVGRIRRLMKRVEEAKSQQTTGVDELWPAIRERIEEKKVVTLRDGAPRDAKTFPLTWLRVTVTGLIAAGLIGLWFVRGRGPAEEPAVVAETPDAGVSLIAVVDSTNAYQQEAQTLLNRLELQRATMRPELSRALERDLRAIDVAIAELQEAIRTDPRNPALRRLLASSYRQKVDLLKRVNNAG